jgi:hypothetical protein
MGWGLKQAVGLTDQGTQCPNLASDQQQVCELLDAVIDVDVAPPLSPHAGTRFDDLPPIEDGLASPQLWEAIRRFQAGEGDLTQDARVDPGGATWNRLIQLVSPGNAPPGPVPLLLTYRESTITELPSSASGYPALIYTIQGNPIAIYSGPGITIELNVTGPIKVSWDGAYPIACVTNPQFAALEAAVASGVARTVGAAMLKNLCAQIQIESRAAIGSLFAGVTATFGPTGALQLKGTIGDGFVSTSVGWLPAERAIFVDGDLPVLQTRPVTGGQATLKGTLRVRVIIKTNNNDYAASLGTVIALAAIGAIALAPIIAGLGAAGASTEAVGGGVTQILLRLPVFAGP